MKSNDRIEWPEIFFFLFSLSVCLSHEVEKGVQKKSSTYRYRAGVRAARDHWALGSNAHRTRVIDLIGSLRPFEEEDDRKCDSDAVDHCSVRVKIHWCHYCCCCCSMRDYGMMIREENDASAAQKMMNSQGIGLKALISREAISS